MTTARELVSRTDNLFSLPEVYYRLDQLLGDPRTRVAELGAVISHDPGLATKLLRLVNSAFYGRAAKVDSLDHAIAIIGFDELSDLVLATMAVEKFNSIPGDLVDMSTFWHHSLYCGLATRQLARRCNILHSERLFVAGLLHDVGQLIIYHQIPELACQVLASAAASDAGLYQAEQQILGFTHSDVGAELFHSWGLPENLISVAQWHHEPGKAGQFRMEAALVHLGNAVANRAEPGRNLLDCQPATDLEAWRATGLEESVIDAVLAEAHEQWLEVITIVSPHAPLL